MLSGRNVFEKWKGILGDNRLIIAIMFLAAGTRLIALSSLPAGVLPDEAYGAYNAWGLMTEGLDSRGYRYPVYFVAWGSGMSVLYSYLAIPIFRLFGVNLLSYRLPQALTGICSVYVIYRLGKEVFDKKMALLLAFVLSINPWHIMNTRFGLDANMAPGMFLTGLMFLVPGVKRKNGYLIGAAVFLGATLYCYALTWILIPLFLLLCVILFWKKIPRNRYTLLFIACLFFLALPLLLFLLINLGVLAEIRTPFLSIPKLEAFRGSELDIAHLGSRFPIFMRLVLSQYGGESHMASELAGAYYLFTTPFMVLGVISHVISFCCRYKNGDNDLQYIFLAWFVSAALMCLLNANITITHTNMLHIPLVFYGVFGIAETARCLKNSRLVPACLIFWSISFALFLQDYVETQSDTGYFINERAGQALERAKELAGENGIVTIFGTTTIKYSYLLWYDRPMISDYYQNVVYEGDPAWAEMCAYGSWRYIGKLEDVKPEGVYVIQPNWMEYFIELGFEVEQVNDLFYVAVASV